MAQQKAENTVLISAPNFKTVKIRIVGTAPYVCHRFSEKARKTMIDAMEAGSQQAKGKKTKQPKDFEAEYEGGKYISADGWYGMPASAFRSAMIAACRLTGYNMSQAKLSVFVEQDGLDPRDGIPLVRIFGEPEMNVMPVRLQGDKTDIRARPMWQSWHADLRIRWDADQFDQQSVINLLLRAGQQVGIGEGRPQSKRADGAGMGWGLFTVESAEGGS